MVFSRRDAEIVVFVTWVTHQQEKAAISIELYDESNQRLIASDPKPIKARPRRTFVQYWPVSSSALKAGIHRVDVVLGPDPVWRGFFRLND